VLRIATAFGGGSDSLFLKFSPLCEIGHGFSAKPNNAIF